MAAAPRLYVSTADPSRDSMAARTITFDSGQPNLEKVLLMRLKTTSPAAGTFGSDQSSVDLGQCDTR